MLVVFSCRDKSQVDVKTPTIDNLTINGMSDNAISIVAGSEITVAYAIKDNIDLASCTFSLHPANDGHTHTGEGSQGGENHLTSGNWSDQESTPVSGTAYNNQKSLQVPDSIAGIWHVEIIAKDESNYSASRAISLTVTNNNLPSITITSCSPEISSDGYIHGSSGTSINILAMANDPNNLAAVYIRLFDGTGQLINEQSVPVSGTTVNFPANFSNSSTGNYRIAIYAYDMLGYLKVWDVPVKIQ